MAVPKRKTGRARTHARRSENDKIAAPSRSLCPECGEVRIAFAPIAVIIAIVKSSKLLSSSTQFVDLSIPRSFAEGFFLFPTFFQLGKLFSFRMNTI